MSVLERIENTNKEVDVISTFVLIICFENPFDKQLTIGPDDGSNDGHQSSETN
jgi:hypothetical protein